MKKLNVLCLSLVLIFSACDKNEVSELEELQIPATYEFLRNGASSVKYPGQTSRINQLKEIKAYMSKGDGGETISADVLIDMFKNKDGNGGGNFSQQYDKQLFDKTFEADQTYFTDLMIEMATNSSTSDDATSGTPGRLTRGNGSQILLDAGGREYTQLIEKGLMGSTFYNQILNNYLTLTLNGVSNDVNNDFDPNDPDQVENNYTTMEHHWDEAFGYTAMPIDFTSNWVGDKQSFWANYTDLVDKAIPGTTDAIMLAFKTGRAAIVSKQYDIKDDQIDKITAQLEIVAAGTCIHYINSTISSSTTADKLHALSEAFAFARALRQIPVDKASFLPSELNEILNTDFGTDYWSLILEENFATLNSIKEKLSAKLGLDAYKDVL